MNNKITPILIILLIAVAFLVGSMWSKIKTLEGEKNGGTTVTTTPAPLGAATGKVEVAINPNDPIKGNPDAPVTIVEFSDFQCSWCGRVEPTLRQILETYKGQVKLIYKDYPAPSHENAEPAALAALCAQEQGKFWEYHDVLFENQGSLTIDDLKRYAADLGLNTQEFNSCLDSKKYKDQIKEDMDEAGRVGVRGTPAFFINGLILSGARPFEDFKAIIDEELGN